LTALPLKLIFKNVPQYYQLSTNKLKIWWDSSRWVALPNSAMACLLGGLLAYAQNKFNLLYFSIALLGVMVVHLGTNLLDDYADLRAGGAGLRDAVRSDSPDPIRTVKAPYVLSGDIKMNQLLIAAFILFSLGIAACIFLTIRSGWPVAVIAAAGAIISFFYSMPPLKFSYRGLGELVVSASLGPGICLGTYYAITGSFSWEPILIALPVGILVGLILFIHSVMDYRPDTAAGKRTLVSVLGSQARAIALLPFILAAAYVIIILGIISGILPFATLLVLLSLPMAVSFIQTSRKIRDGKYDAIRARWWMGPMEQMLEGHDWFIIAWRQARNLLIFFTLLIFIAYFIVIIY
jgi:1,4-dihydroxy-2-naphthoate octaprenyltransferase